MRAIHWVFGAFLMFGTVACSDHGGTPDADSGTPDGVIGTPDGDLPDRTPRDDVDAGLCCPIDPTPGCCMRYGGSLGASGCSTVCDGMAWPNDPRWEKRIDAKGCPYWADPPYDPARGACGLAPHDAGFDSPDVVQVPDVVTPIDVVQVPDVVTPIDVQDHPEGGSCCPIDPTPGCCMNYGGSRAWGCVTVCDGMAWPNDPRWEKQIDANGCLYWVNPPYDPARGVCGHPRWEAGVDAPDVVTPIDVVSPPDVVTPIDVQDHPEGGI